MKMCMGKYWCRDRTRLFLAVVSAFLLLLSGCGVQDDVSQAREKLDVTVVEDEDVPRELMEIIENKKNECMQLTFATNDYLYMVEGYGKQQGSGYSIVLDEVSVGGGAIYMRTTLMGPKSGETSAKVVTYPYIVVKTERREEPVVFG